MNNPYIPQAQNPLVISNGLISYWSFNESQGTVLNDFSGKRNTGTVVGATWGSSGIAGSCLKFTGTNYVTCSATTDFDFTTASPFTITAWVYPIHAGPDNQGGSIIIKEATSGTVGWFLYSFFTGANTGVYWQTNTSGWITHVALTASAWNHVALVHSNVSESLWLNGVNRLSRANQTLTSGGSGLVIGAWRNTTSITQNWSGSIDEVRVYNRNLSAAEIGILYSAKGT